MSAISICVAPIAWAQDEEGLEDLEMEIFFAPAETVTSAARHLQPLELSPSAITVLTREDLEAAGARTLPEALRLVPNMDVNRVKPLWTSVGVRGRTYINADSTLLLVDGRDATFEFFGFPMWTVQSFSLDDVERIEVIRGPGSALYGANAFSGVVNVITREPGSGPTASVSLRGGEKGRAELACRGTHKFGPVALDVTAGVERQDFWTARDTEAMDVVRGRLAGTIDLGEDSKLRLEAGAYRGAGPLYTYLGEGTIYSGRDIFASARYELDELVVKAVYDMFSFDVDFGVKLIFPEQNLELARVPRTTTRVDKTMLVAMHAVEFFHNHLTYGTEYILNFYHSDILVNPDHTEHRVGVFLQDEIDLGGLLGRWMEGEPPALFLTAGLRFDYNSVTDYELSPRASVVWAFLPGHTIRLGYAHAFLKPTFFETSMDVRVEDINGLGVHRMSMASPDLENETIDSIEVGYSGSFLDDKLVLRLDLAYNWLRNGIQFEVDFDEMEYLPGGIPNLAGPGYHFVNLSSGMNGHNIEFQIIGKPSDRSRLFFQAGYRQIFDQETGKFAVGEPVWRLAAGADLNGEDGWSASVRAYYTHSMTMSIRHPDGPLWPNVIVDLPASWFLDARFAWTLVEKPGRVSVGVEAHNLLNFRFREFGGRDNPNAPDFGGEMLGRMITVFLHGEI